MEWIKDIKVLVFDLDGTLYQDENFVRPYLTHMFEGSNSESVVSMWSREVERMLNGQHALKIGHFFSKAYKSGLRHRGGEIIGMYDWEGKEGELLTEPFSHSIDDIHYIGDAWGVLGTIAEYADVPVSKRSEAFMAVRREMISELNSVKPHIGVQAAIRGLGSIRHTLLMTNSPEDAARDFVVKLGLDNAFDAIVYGGEKPHGLSDYLQRYMREHDIAPEQIASIGDNAWNDLYPVKRLGGRTILISPYETHDDEVWDLRLRTLDELESFLIKFSM